MSVIDKYEGIKGVWWLANGPKPPKKIRGILHTEFLARSLVQFISIEEAFDVSGLNCESGTIHLLGQQDGTKSVCEYQVRGVLADISGDPSGVSMEYRYLVLDGGESK